jgi:hypothetical protein
MYWLHYQKILCIVRLSHSSSNSSFSLILLPYLPLYRSRWPQRVDFGRLVTGIVGSNPARSMDVCLCVCVLLSCVGRGLCDGRSLIQRSPTKRLSKITKRPVWGSLGRTTEPLMMMMMTTTTYIYTVFLFLWCLTFAGKYNSQSHWELEADLSCRVKEVLDVLVLSSFVRYSVATFVSISRKMSGRKNAER